MTVRVNVFLFLIGGIYLEMSLIFIVFFYGAPNIRKQK